MHDNCALVCCLCFHGSLELICTINMLFTFIFVRQLLMLVTKFCRGDPIPSKLIEKVDDYIPHQFGNLLNIAKVSS